MAIRKRKKADLVLPLSSMGDIAFLLIIFFMLASNFMTTSNVDLEKPKSQGLEQQDNAKVSVLMDRDGVIWYQGAPCSASEVSYALKEMVDEKHDLPVHVSIHNELPRKDFMPLIQAVSDAGVKMILTGEKEE